MAPRLSVPALLSGRMPAAVVVAILVLATAPVVRGTGASQDQTPAAGVMRSVLVTVLDEDGAPLRGMTAADFTMTENGEARPVVSVELSSEPLFVVIVADTTQPPGQNRQILDLREGLRAFLSMMRAANPGGNTAFIESAGSALLKIGFDARPAAIDDRLRRLGPTIQIESSVLEAIRDASRLVGETPSLRRAIVAVDLDSVDPPGAGAEEVVAAVTGSGAALWSISVRASGRASPRREAVLNHLPPRTGGLRQTTILSRTLPDLLRGLARTLTSQYVVSYRGSAADPVTSVRPGVSRGAKVLMAPWVR